MKRTFDQMDIDTPGGLGRTQTIRRSTVIRRPVARGRGLTGVQKRQVSTLIHRNQELKYLATVFGPTAITSTASIVSTNFDVPQGDTDQSRDGDQLMWCGHIDLTAQMVNGQGATGDTYNNIRFIIFQWHPNSSPTATLLLISGPSGNPDIYSQYNHDNRQQYKILFDKVWKTVGPNLSTSNGITDMTTTGVLKYKISLARATKKAQYIGGGAQGTNRLYILYVSDSVLATHPTLAFASKVVFRDS